jgi:UPF0716 protein FxsA
MRFLFSAALIGLPLLDLASLILVGGRIGAWQTLALVLLSAGAGVLMIRAQGFALLSQARKTLEAGRFPARQAFDGVCTLIGGVLLILPGFVSDVLGTLLLLPPCRAMLLAIIGRQIRRSGHFAFWNVERPAAPDGERSGSVIEGEYETVEPASARDAGPSGDGPLRRSPWRSSEVANVVPPDKT